MHLGSSSIPFFRTRSPPHSTESDGQKLRRAELSFSGDYHMIPQGENAFIISNHQTWSDFYAIHALAQRKGMLNRCRYFAKSSLKYIPFFGYVAPACCADCGSWALLL